MKVYRKTKSGFIECINTQGSFKPKGWSTSIGGAMKKKTK